MSYSTACLIQHKLMQAMSERKSAYTLSGLIRDADDHSRERTRMIFAWMQRQNMPSNLDGAQPMVVLIDGQRSLLQAATHLPGEDVAEIREIIHVVGYR